MPKMMFTKKNRVNKTEDDVGFLEIKNTSDNAASLYIYGDIVSDSWGKWSEEDTCPKDIAEFLAGIDDDADLTVYLNSGGGDVYAGIGIHSILQRHKGHVKGVVDGIAASIASVILMACDEIEVSNGAQIMIHKPLTYGWGNADDFRDVIEHLDRCQEMITDIYMAKARDGVSREDIEAAINAETWMSGAEAAEKFEIKTVDTEPVAACTGGMLNRYKKVPEKLDTVTVQDLKKTEEQEKKEILKDLFLFGM